MTRLMPPGTFAFPVICAGEAQAEAAARTVLSESWLGPDFPVEVVSAAQCPAPERVHLEPGMRCYEVTMRALS